MTIQNDEQITGFIHHTESFGAVDGPSIRFVLFLQGCNLRCLYCHNPDAIAVSGGTEWTVEKTVKEVLRYRNFIRSGGVTFSGGEPLLQARFVTAVAQRLRREGIHVALDTSGSRSPEIPEIGALIREVDLLLLDIKAVDSQVCKRLTGRDNTDAFKTLQYCQDTSKPVWIRHVLLKGFTLDDHDLEALAQRLKPYSCIERVELLPFHKLGEPKWAEVGRTYELNDTPATTREELENAGAIFRAQGFRVE